ncbi:MAG: ATP-dependent zinc metalloprotease FtsH [candidate division WOR-3 bacterium]|nr:ATP-dependent zinc metalloprotease FtsH [candidate division WOR-3 bacterium]MCX7947877.1 ATP-dependent zinc metalloprotease FtsH [candidate division WOR-3 bacterium]MDW8150699.1 ATP-dependent zinc metalloprotease FtsH [candidate division WOR-3 bacterium]
MQKNIFNTLLIWIVIIGSFLIVFTLFNPNNNLKLEITYNQFINFVNENKIASITIIENELEGEFKEALKIGDKQYKYFKIILPYKDEQLMREVIQKGIIIKTKNRNVFWEIFLSYLPWIVLFIIFWFIFLRSISNGASRAIEFSQSRAKIYVDNKPNVRFDDVADAEEAKEDLKEVVEFLKNREKYTKLGAKIPKGILLVGPPGVGKTLLAKAVAGEAGVPFLSISGSDFVEMFVGVGAARVRDLFQKAKQLAPAIIFIDEIDAVGRMRGSGIGGGHDEREQTLNQLLVEMDGFEGKEGIVILAATNRPDILDPALLRPGRFDRKVFINLPDVKGRLEILKIHAKDKPLSEDVDLEKIAQTTPGFSGADLANLINEAALLAARAGRDKITLKDLEEAKDKIIMGAAKRNLVLSEDEKRRVAYHEAGHALVSRMLPNTDKIQKVSIIPRGMALGVTVPLPEKDKYLYEESYLKNQLAILMGGRVAEKIVFNEVSSGAANDLERSTQIARKMVMEWGMSKAIGPIHISTDGQIFIGKEIAKKNGTSEDFLKIADEETKRILEEAENTAFKILTENIDKLHLIARMLLEKETITGEELDQILKHDKVENQYSTT